MANVLEKRFDDLETLYWLAEDLDEFLSNVALGGMENDLRYMREERAFLRRKYGAFVKKIESYRETGLNDIEDHILTAYGEAMVLGRDARNFKLGLPSTWGYIVDEWWVDTEGLTDVIYENLIFHEDEFEKVA